MLQTLEIPSCMVSGSPKFSPNPATPATGGDNADGHGSYGSISSIANACLGSNHTPGDRWTTGFGYHLGWLSVAPRGSGGSGHTHLSSQKPLRSLAILHSTLEGRSLETAEHLNIRRTDIQRSPTVHRIAETLPTLPKVLKQIKPCWSLEADKHQDIVVTYEFRSQSVFPLLDRRMRRMSCEACEADEDRSLLNPSGTLMTWWLSSPPHHTTHWWPWGFLDFADHVCSQSSLREKHGNPNL